MAARAVCDDVSTVTVAPGADDGRVPVTILTGGRGHGIARRCAQVTPLLTSARYAGFLGSGKTTLLNHILTRNHGRKIGEHRRGRGGGGSK
jgi:alkylation response protein AidB-like acyl-CoA dehydrogenase